MKPTQKRLTSQQKNTLQGWLLLLPTVVFLLIFTVYPIFRSIYLSFFKADLSVRAPLFTGASNYLSLFQSDLFWKVMLNTLTFTLLTVIPSMVIGFGLAMLVNNSRKGVGLLRTGFFYPVVMPMIAIASIWMFIYMAKNGLLDQMLLQLGLAPLGVLNSKTTVLPAMAFMYTWKEAGYLMIFFLSGLQNIDLELYEAAEIDGAGRFRILRSITIPQLMPTVLFVSTIALTNSVKLVDHIIIMTEGAPNNASTTLLYYIYQQGFTNFDQGMASSLTVILLVVMLAISMLQFIKTDDKIHYG